MNIFTMLSSIQRYIVKKRKLKFGHGDGTYENECFSQGTLLRAENK